MGTSYYVRENVFPNFSDDILGADLKWKGWILAHRYVLEHLKKKNSIPL